MLKGKGVFKTTNALFASGALPESKALVQLYAKDVAAFHAAFAKSYLRMGCMGAQWQTYGLKLLPA